MTIAYAVEVTLFILCKFSSSTYLRMSFKLLKKMLQKEYKW